MANYKARLQLKHGKKADLPTDGRLAEPMYCTDTHELAIGNDKGEEYTFIGGVSKEQIEALERSLNEAIELATKTASAIENARTLARTLNDAVLMLKTIITA